MYSGLTDRKHQESSGNAGGIAKLKLGIISFNSVLSYELFQKSLCDRSARSAARSKPFAKAICRARHILFSLSRMNA